MDKRPVIAITIGDPAGIGPEILVKALSLREIYKNSMPIVIGDYGTVRDALAMAGSVQRINRLCPGMQPAGKQGTIDLVDLRNVDSATVCRGSGSPESIRAAGQYLEKAVEMARKGLIQAVVGGPASREAIAGRMPGGSLTLGVAGNFRVAYPSEALPFQDVPAALSIEKVRAAVRIAYQAGRRMGIAAPRLAVLGLSACPESQAGPEERRIIGPAVALAAEEGIAAGGPLSVGRVVRGMWRGEFDIAVAVYHEQGVALMEALDVLWPECSGRWPSKAGARLVCGLPFPFTTVDHGPEFEVAWHNRGRSGSLVEAIRLAVAVTGGGEERCHESAGA